MSWNTIKEIHNQMTIPPQNAEAGDMYIDPALEKTFYFTGERWVDITRQKKEDDPHLEESSY